MSRTKKYFWLKLRRDFFKRHDTKIIESMENGKDYLLFYLKLLVESIDHEGSLRFSDTIPYNDKMLATITDTNIDIVRSAVKVFSELGMMEQLDDGTLFMSHVQTMIGFETSDALRMKEIRDAKKQVLIEQETSEQRSQMFAERSPSVQECSKSFKNRSPELEIDIEKEREKEEEVPLTFESFAKQCAETWNTLGLKPAFRFTTSAGLTGKEREGFLTASARYSMDEIIQAMRNYHDIGASSEHEVFPKGYGLSGFLAGGVEKFTDDSEPWTRCKIKPKVSPIPEKVPSVEVPTAEETREELDRRRRENEGLPPIDAKAEFEKFAKENPDNPFVKRRLAQMESETFGDDEGFADEV